MSLESQQDSPEQAISDHSSQDAPPMPIRSNAWESALEAWQTVLQLAPDHPIAPIQRIECLIRLRRWDAVAAACATAEPELVVGDEIRLARKLMTGQAYEEALELWERIVGRAKSDEQALTAIRAQLRCFAKLGVTGRKPKVDAVTGKGELGNEEFGRRRANRDPRHVAILGVSYCGSTLLSLVLGALPGVANIGESHWLLEPRAGKRRESHNLTADGFEQCVFCGANCVILTDDLRDQLARQPAAFYGILAEALSTDILVSADKNYPHFIRRDPGLHNDAIVLFRDPLKNWQSQARRSGNSPEARLRYFENWAMDYVNFLDNYPNAGRKVVLDFDEFLANPVSMLQQLCGAIDLSFTAEAVEYWNFPQHCVGGNVSVRARIAKHDLEALQAAPKLDTTEEEGANRIDQLLPEEALAVVERLRNASLRAAD